MNKKVIAKIGTMVAVMAIIAIVVAKLYDIGIHRPSLMFRQLSPSTIQWLNTFNTFNPESIMKATKIGPFEWDNKDDIGQKHTAGKWGKEENANVVVYYRKDRDAKGQINAQRVKDCAESAILGIRDYLSTYHYPSDLNGRKVPFYLPSNDKEYRTLLDKMSDNGANATSKYGCSIIAIGPLGCQVKGIIIHPDAFTMRGANEDWEYIRVIRRELAYYTYLANLDYNQDSHRFAWFVQGITENFALEGYQIMVSPAKVQKMENTCSLNAEFPAGDSLSLLGGTTFIQFFERTYGNMALKDLIDSTYKMPVDSAFIQLQLNTDSLKQQWMKSLNEY